MGHPLVLLGGALLVIVLLQFMRSYWRLRKFPGPRLAILTDLWFFSKLWTGGNWREIAPALHAQYGPVVRYGPNKVSFSDPSALPIIFSTSIIFAKVRFSYLSCKPLASNQRRMPGRVL